MEKILISNDNNTKELNLLNRRIFKNKIYDIIIAIIEIKEEDGINNYMELDDRIINYINNNEKILFDEPYKIINYYQEILNISYIIDSEYIFLFLPKEGPEFKYELLNNTNKRDEINGNIILTINNKFIGIPYENDYDINYAYLAYSIKEFIHKYYDTKNE